MPGARDFFLAVTIIILAVSIILKLHAPQKKEGYIATWHGHKGSTASVRQEIRLLAGPLFILQYHMP